VLLFNVVPRNSSSCNLGGCVQSSNLELEGGFFFLPFLFGVGGKCEGRGAFLVANWPDFPRWGLDSGEQG
jgi:hypothetical protein